MNSSLMGNFVKIHDEKAFHECYSKQVNSSLGEQLRIVNRQIFDKNKNQNFTGNQ